VWAAQSEAGVYVLEGRRSFSHSTGWRLPPAVRDVQGSSSNSKVWTCAEEAVSDVKSGSVLLSSGFGLCGVPCKCKSLSTWSEANPARTTRY
jgi:hypothetical protein